MFEMQNYGLMFHHFYDAGHPRGQGAISGSELADLINYVGRDKIIPAKQYLHRAQDGAFTGDEICLTFDDALLCQYDIAFPVLRDMGLTAFWFAYSSVFEGNIEPLEVYRHFRTMHFGSVDEFYDRFFRATEETYPQAYSEKLKDFVPETYLDSYPFYTRNDRIFRYLRDDVLGVKRYHAVMDEMIEASGLDVSAIANKLWMTNGQLKNLHGQGHVIGLHSYSHPTRLAELPKEEQRREYLKNFDHISTTLGVKPVTMSHPCNSYSAETFPILEELGIQLGFRANMKAMADRTKFEIPREDHANVMKRMQQ
jgi:peptidoglycan/xylan/chitin deacetylase (PgdA/CDA1 family)